MFIQVWLSLEYLPGTPAALEIIIPWPCMYVGTYAILELTADCDEFKLGCGLCLRKGLLSDFLSSLRRRRGRARRKGGGRERKKIPFSRVQQQLTSEFQNGCFLDILSVCYSPVTHAA